MTKKVVPMIHVPDVRTTMDCYVGLGFEVVGQNEEDGELNWAALKFGESTVMLSQGGKPSEAHRREFDLYVHIEDVDGFFETVKDRVEIVEAPHDTFYGMREFVIRDINRFWMTFGQPVKPE